MPKIKSNLETFENRPLPYPAASFSKIKKDIQKQIMIDDEVIEQIIHHLVTEKNLLLVGPVGSGKTKLASILPQIVWQKRGGYHSEIVTATSEWTTQDVIGGIIPKLDENNEVKYVIQKGCVTDTVAKNWQEKFSFYFRMFVAENPFIAERRILRSQRVRAIGFQNHL